MGRARIFDASDVDMPEAVRSVLRIMTQPLIGDKPVLSGIEKFRQARIKMRLRSHTREQQARQTELLRVDVQKIKIRQYI